MTEDGIILNNEMDDFSTPGFTNAFGFEPSPINFIRPYRRPLSSSAPVIVLDDDGVVQFVAGASGGARITTAVAQVALNVLSFCDTVRDAVDKSRIHHQLLPVWIFGESDYPDERVVELVSTRIVLLHNVDHLHPACMLLTHRALPFLRPFQERIGHYWNYTSSNGVCQAIARGTVGPKDADPNLLYAASDNKRKSGAIASGY
jgi:gamma-glutamyltranspeptidase